MGNPFAGVAQLGVNQFWNGLQQLQNKGNSIKAGLSADRLQLMNLYTIARNDPDQARGAANMKALDPVIHQNSVLRMQYQDLVSKFNQAVNGASTLLKRAGLTTPTLSGLGFEPVSDIVIVGVAILAAATAWGIATAVLAATSAQRARTAALAAMMSNPNLTPDQRAAAAKALAKDLPKDNLFGDLTPLVAIAAIIYLGPSVMKMLEGRKSAAA
jgi:hypothetical protein